MATGTAIVIMLEILATLLLVWGWCNEKKIIAIEDRLIEKIRARAKGGKNHVGR